MRVIQGGDISRMSEIDKRRLKEWDPCYLRDSGESFEHKAEELLLINSFLNSQTTFDAPLPPTVIEDRRQTVIKWNHSAETVTTARTDCH
jgi:hypothetical protein